MTHDGLDRGRLEVARATGRLESQKRAPAGLDLESRLTTARIDPWGRVHTINHSASTRRAGRLQNQIAIYSLMDAKHYPPVFELKQFNCVYCGVYAAQMWRRPKVQMEDGLANLEDLRCCNCAQCGKWSYWYQEKQVIPTDGSAPRPADDMPDDCLVDFEEARSVFSISPRSAAALLRLTLQKLLVRLGEKGKKIDDDIRSLVSKGLPPEVRRAMDICRIAGNNAVHPGELDLNDTPEVAFRMFGLLNFIVRERITRPKEIEELWGTMPEGARETVEKRDKS